MNYFNKQTRYKTGKLIKIVDKYIKLMCEN